MNLKIVIAIFAGIFLGAAATLYLTDQPIDSTPHPEKPKITATRIKIVPTTEQTQTSPGDESGLSDQSADNSDPLVHILAEYSNWSTDELVLALTAMLMDSVIDIPFLAF